MTLRKVTLILLSSVLANAFAQVTGPKGLYRLSEIAYCDGHSIVPEFTQYKYCGDNITLQVSLSTDDRLVFQSESYFLHKNEAEPITYTGSISETEDKGVQAFPLNDDSFVFRWYNSTMEHSKLFPYRQNIDEIYNLVKDENAYLVSAFKMLGNQLGNKVSDLQGVWKLRGRQTQNRPNSQFWIEEPQTGTYRIFSDSRCLTITLDDKFPASRAGMEIKRCELVGNEAYIIRHGAVPVHWFDANTVSTTIHDKDGNIEVQIWDRCGLPRHVQDLFGTDVPVVDKDLTSFSCKQFENVYGEKPDSIKQAFESFITLVMANEENNCDFPLIMEAGFQQEYTDMWVALRDKVIGGEMGFEEAAANYIFWFNNNFDRHIQLENSPTLDRLIMEHLTNYHKLIKEYKPMPVACKVDDETFLVRIPSCMGDFPTLEWINQKVEEFKVSGCPYLILDVRGNGGGMDFIGSPFYTMLGDCGAKEEVRIDFRNSFFNRRHMLNIEKDRGPGFVDEIAGKIRADSESMFLDWQTMQKGDEPYTPQVKRGAVIMDSFTASSGESFVAFVKRHSMTHAKVYAKDNSEGAEKSGNILPYQLPNTDVVFWYPMTAEASMKETCKTKKLGWSPDVKIPLPYPEKLTDNIDEWVLWVAKDMKKREF